MVYLTGWRRSLAVPSATCYHRPHNGARVLGSTLAMVWSRRAPHQTDSPHSPPVATPGKFAPACTEALTQNCASTFYRDGNACAGVAIDAALTPPMSPSIDQPTCRAFPSTLGITEVPTECPPTISACGVTWWVQVSPRPFDQSFPTPRVSQSQCSGLGPAGAHMPPEPHL